MRVAGADGAVDTTARLGIALGVTDGLPIRTAIAMTAAAAAIVLTAAMERRRSLAR